MSDENTPDDDATDAPLTDADAPLEGDDAPEDDAGKFDPEKTLEKIRKLNSEATNLRKRTKAAEEKAAGSDEKDTRITALVAENLRIRIGAKHGLPEGLIDRLKGDTEEEILADAEKLLALVASPTKRPPGGRPNENLRGGTEPPEDVEETDVSKLGARMFRR